MRKNNLFLKLKEDKGARSIAITITLMLLVLTAIIVTTVVANRRLEEETPLGDDSWQAGVENPDDGGEDDGTDGGADNGASDGGANEGEGDAPSDDAQTNALPTHFLLPVSGVLQKGHDATLQVFSPTMGDYRVHLGIDIGTMAGANVAAMADGVITQVWEDVSMGQCVAVKHGGDAYTIYKNLSAELPAGTVVGAAVKAGDVIGTVGESAMVELSEEPHLHLEMTVGGLQVSPLDYLDEDAKATLNEDTNYEDVS